MRVGPSLLLMLGLFACRNDNEVIRQVGSDLFYQVPTDQVDILWVTDNSCSMADEQAAIGAKFESFIGSIVDSNIDFHIGVITTDLVAADQAGKLQAPADEPLYLDANVPDYAGRFRERISVGTQGSDREAGIDAAFQALSQPLVSGFNDGFRRPEAGLHILVYSDGDDTSDAFLGEDAVALLQAHLAAEALHSGRSASLHAIVGPGPAGCATEEAHATHGARYLAAATATGGAAWSICEAGLAARWADLLPLPEDLPTTFPLSAVPLEGQLSVTVDEAPTPEGWSLDLNAPALVFDEAPAAGARIAVRYAVAP